MRKSKYGVKSFSYPEKLNPCTHEKRAVSKTFSSSEPLQGNCPEVTLIIPTWQGGQDLLDCLSSIIPGSLQPAVILLVDNASTDGSIERALQLFPEVKVIRNPDNQGFGAACNLGIEKALADNSEFVLLLNQDARLEPDTLSSMVELATQQPRAAAIGAKTLSTTRCPDGTFMLLYNGAWRRILPTWQKIPGIGKSSRNAGNEPREVDYVWGHGLLLRSSALKEVGLFDTGFFMYFEDLDLCWRLQKSGWQNWCDSRVVMFHAVEDANRARRSRLWRWQMKAASARHFCRKHAGPVRGEILWALTLLRETEPLLRQGHFQAAAHVWQAWWWVFSGAPEARPEV